MILPAGEAIAVADIRDALVIKEGDLFLMTDTDGNLPIGQDAGYGLYKGDTRHLCISDLTFDGVRPTVLLSTAELGYSSEQHLTNPAMITASGRPVLKDTIEMRRLRVINDSLLETIHVTNFNAFPVTLRLRLDFGADFADIFEVRGERRSKRGTMAAPVVGTDTVGFSYQGLDGVMRETTLRFSPPPDHLSAKGAVFDVSLANADSTTVTLAVTPEGKVTAQPLPVVFGELAASYKHWLGSHTQVSTDNEFFNAMMERSLMDIRTLQVSGADGTYIAAGTPWFSALFGRDSLITSFQMLAFNPQLAGDTLRILAKRQGQRKDDWRDEEPGKILHELREGEMAAAGEIPMTPYYGSVDATPLFLMLAAEYLSWTDDLDLVREIERNLITAIEWTMACLASDDGGYVTYSNRSSRGLVNQGWKDSHDGIVNGDGSLVRPPIALVEVQAYAYAALQAMGSVLRRLGKQKLADDCLATAASLLGRLNRDFWMAEEEYFAVALGLGGAPAATITSNPGHALWAGAIERDKARPVVNRLFSNDMFSGWGVRTLSTRSPRYNPHGYHLGTVWPHDNALLGMGLKRYGFEDELEDLATAVYDSSRSFDYFRLPELFCGVPRTAHGFPVRYPVAARPQAWAAGTIPLVLQAILGLVPNAPANRLTVVRPQLPHWLNEVEVRGLRVGKSAVDLLFVRRQGRTRMSVTRARGVTVRRVNEWPRQALA